MKTTLTASLFCAAFAMQALAAGDATAGKAIYDKSCKSCHGAAGAANPAIAKMMKVEMKDLGSGETQGLSDDATEAPRIGDGRRHEIIIEVDELSAHPLHQAREVFFHIDGGPGVGDILQVRTPVGRPKAPVAPPPKHGQHTREVLAEYKFSDAEIAALTS